MPRTPNVRIVEWGTPPDPEPTGWDAIAAELKRKPGQWANVGTMSIATARKVTSERLAEPEYESRIVNTKDGKIAVWVRAVEPTGEIETTEAIGSIDVDGAAKAAQDRAVKETADRLAEGPKAEPKSRTVKRGAVI